MVERPWPKEESLRSRRACMEWEMDLLGWPRDHSKCLYSVLCRRNLAVTRSLAGAQHP